MSTSPIDNLELQALEERTRLHDRAEELRAKVQSGRENLKISYQARRHFVAASLFVGVLSFTWGHYMGGYFCKR